jgi:predicted nucleotidyltransferase
MDREKLLSELLVRLRAAEGENLVSVILYGSAAEGEFHAEYSDLNVLCVLENSGFAHLREMAGLADWWRRQKHHPPLVVNRGELEHSAAAFSIEFLDMKERHRVLVGEDVLRALEVPRAKHRAQIEYELKEKLFLLRQHLLLAANKEKQLWEVMLHSLSSFTTLFRHMLMELGEAAGKPSRPAVEELSRRLDFDPAAFLELMDVRARKADRKRLRAVEVTEKYLAAIEKVAAAAQTAGP